MSDPRPPRLLERLLEWALPNGLSGQGTLGDLAEGFERRARLSPLRARVWYALQTGSLVIYGAVRRDRNGRSEVTSGLSHDFRWAIRSITRRPGFHVGVVTVLGLGIGANVAVFSVVNGTLDNTRWWRAPDATVAIWPDNKFSFGQLDLYSEEQTAYRAIGGYDELAIALQTRDGGSESVNAVRITPDLFRQLAVRPQLGRGLTEEDDWFGAERVVVIGDALWQRAFGRDPSVVGTRVRLSGTPATIIGVMAPGGNAPGGRAELWMPLVMDPRDDDFWKSQSITFVGVLKDGLGLDQAQEDLLAFTDRLSELFPMFYPERWAHGIATVSRADAAQRRMVSTPLLLLLAGTGLLMVVTALNVGNLLLSRAIDRRRELAVRVSLGADRNRVVRQLVVEGLVLTALAMTVGLATGAWGGNRIAELFVEEAVVVSSSVLSPPLLAFTGVVCAVGWLVLNAVPIGHFLRVERIGLTVKPHSGASLQRGLVSLQAALATLLMVSATLLVATVGNLRDVPLGFDPEGMLTVELSLPEDRVATPAAARTLYDRLTAAVRAVPGVTAAGLTGWLPLRVEAPPSPINLRAAPVDQREAERAAKHRVDPGFFAAFGVEALAGRLLDETDREEQPAPGPAFDPQPSAVVVNQTLADRLWPEGNALGQMMAVDPHTWDTWVPVVGVIPDVRSAAITGPIDPAMYVALAEVPSRDVTVVVRHEGPAANLIPALRAAVRSADPVVPIRAISEMETVVKAAYATSWVMMGLLLVLAGLSTGLGAIGIYAVLTHHVALNRREIAVRIAVGAKPGTVARAVVKSGLILAVAGVLMGSAAAAVSNRFLETLLFEVSALAPTAFLAPALALAAAAAVAAWVPAVRAARLPPAMILRDE